MGIETSQIRLGNQFKLEWFPIRYEGTCECGVTFVIKGHASREESADPFLTTHCESCKRYLVVKRTDVDVSDR